MTKRKSNTNFMGAPGSACAWFAKTLDGQKARPEDRAFLRS